MVSYDMIYMPITSHELARKKSLWYCKVKSRESDITFYKACRGLNEYNVPWQGKLHKCMDAHNAQPKLRRPGRKAVRSHLTRRPVQTAGVG